jgi:hypothetical protein
MRYLCSDLDTDLLIIQIKEVFGFLKDCLKQLVFLFYCFFSLGCDDKI